MPPDNPRRAGTLQQFVTKARPTLSRLKLAKRKFLAAKGGSLSYRDSQRAQTKLTIYRAVRRNGHKTYVLVKTLTHSDRAGTNKVKLKGGWLKVGSYRLKAQAHNADGTSRTLTRKFRAT